MLIIMHSFVPNFYLPKKNPSLKSINIIIYLCLYQSDNSGHKNDMSLDIEFLSLISLFVPLPGAGGLVVRKVDNAIHRTVILSTVVKMFEKLSNHSYRTQNETLAK